MQLLSFALVATGYREGLMGMLYVVGMFGTACVVIPKAIQEMKS